MNGDDDENEDEDENDDENDDENEDYHPDGTVPSSRGTSEAEGGSLNTKL